MALLPFSCSSAWDSDLYRETSIIGEKYELFTSTVFLLLTFVLKIAHVSFQKKITKGGLDSLTIFSYGISSRMCTFKVDLHLIYLHYFLLDYMSVNRKK